MTSTSLMTAPALVTGADSRRQARDTPVVEVILLELGKCDGDEAPQQDRPRFGCS